MNKIAVIGLISLLVACNGGSSGSSNKTANALVGTWVGNCTEVKDVETGEFIGYSVDTYTFEKGDNYTQKSVYYSDSECVSENGAIEDYYGSYSIGRTLIASDGLSASLVSMTMRSTAWPDYVGTVDLNIVIRASETNFNVGYYKEGETPSINYDITYIKQSSSRYSSH